ncbi:hypothetical protein WK66_08800 [Burkholderia ubonensis]|uniref:hypothetical protein n=1 Tax=Burkholderia ubonensis TaxID=101571 RepID=UPI000759A019|nr:hypothetical protein [Burkholderia ubonensis]KVU28417.1 hypothetical protein WK66_08800 [Burkholderia ubonensis]
MTTSKIRRRPLRHEIVEPHAPNAQATRTLRTLIRLQELRKIQREAEVARQRNAVEEVRRCLQQAEQDLADAVDVERRRWACLHIEYLQQNASVTRVRNWASALRECVNRTKEFEAARAKAQSEFDAAAAQLAQREAVLRDAMRGLEKYTYLLERELEN